MLGFSLVFTYGYEIPNESTEKKRSELIAGRFGCGKCHYLDALSDPAVEWILISLSVGVCITFWLGKRRLR